MTHPSSEPFDSPITQDLNLLLTQLLGQCPSSSDGAWVDCTASNESLEPIIVFPAMPIPDAQKLVSILTTINAQREESKSGRAHKAPYQASDAANSLPADVSTYKYHLKAD
ncbi:hypothetical protein LBMAG13_05480 [Actinomycetes bacterium]|nr:hypothetical protein LBMAG13_05480 [Actinomycetes bacterium]